MLKHWHVNDIAKDYLALKIGSTNRIKVAAVMLSSSDTFCIGVTGEVMGFGPAKSYCNMGRVSAKSTKKA